MSPTADAVKRAPDEVIAMAIRDAMLKMEIPVMKRTILSIFVAAMMMLTAVSMTSVSAEAASKKTTTSTYTSKDNCAVSGIHFKVEKDF